MPDIAFLNGAFLPLAEARVSVEDRGFLFGDGVYEVIRTYDGAPFLLPAHLDRLERSMAEVRLVPDWTRAALEGWIAEAVERAGYTDAKIYVQVTRGAAPREHKFPEVPVTTLIAVTPIASLPQQMQDEGAAVISVPDLRWGRCDVKSLQLLPNVMARQEAAEAGAFEALLVGPDGVVNEGAGSNLFVVNGGALVTPALGPRILAGVSRGYLLDLARGMGIVTEERDLRLAEIYDAEEVLLSGTTTEVLGVVRVDGRTVGGGRPGPVTRRLAAAFRPSGSKVG
jgi:D-alanine transaminase